MKKNLAVLTSGGDSPGMNACIRAIVRTACFYGYGVIGIKNGYKGLVNGAFVPLKVGSVGNIIQRGGTMLGSSRSKEFLTKSGRKRAYEFLKAHRVSHLITLGGDGTFRGASIFSKEFPIKVVGVPCTIDNDIGGTDFCIGFDTAVNTAVECIDRIRDTADSHGRVFVIEVMGRNTGHLALETALAVGAEFVVVPEVKFNLKSLIKKIQAGIDRGKSGSIVIVAEAEEPGRAFPISKSIQKFIRRDVRTSILGHLQRGGSPSGRDRNLASRLGSQAVQCLSGGSRQLMVAIKNEKVVVRALGQGIKIRRRAELSNLKLIHILSV